MCLNGSGSRADTEAEVTSLGTIGSCDQLTAWDKAKCESREFNWTTDVENDNLFLYQKLTGSWF